MEECVFCTQENQYAGAARNNGMKEAQGEYLLFLDADDFFENTLLEKVYNQGKKMEADIVLFGAKQYNDKTGIVSPASWYFKGCSSGRILFPEKQKIQMFLLL